MPVQRHGFHNPNTKTVDRICSLNSEKNRSRAPRSGVQSPWASTTSFTDPFSFVATFPSGRGFSAAEAPLDTGRSTLGTCASWALTAGFVASLRGFAGSSICLCFCRSHAGPFFLASSRSIVAPKQLIQGFSSESTVLKKLDHTPQQRQHLGCSTTTDAFAFVQEAFLSTALGVPHT